MLKYLLLAGLGWMFATHNFSLEQIAAKAVESAKPALAEWTAEAQERGLKVGGGSILDDLAKSFSGGVQVEQVIRAANGQYVTIKRAVDHYSDRSEQHTIQAAPVESAFAPENFYTDMRGKDGYSFKNFYM